MYENEPKQKPLTLDEALACKHDNCSCDMVYPIDWQKSEGALWDVTLRCPNCEDSYSGLLDTEVIEQLDMVLDRGTDSIVQDFRNLSYANMVTYVNRFVDALNGDHILPEDF